MEVFIEIIKNVCRWEYHLLKDVLNYLFVFFFLFAVLTNFCFLIWDFSRLNFVLFIMGIFQGIRGKKEYLLGLSEGN